jgi:hypothetical protein
MKRILYTTLLLFCLSAGFVVESRAQEKDSIHKKARWSAEGRADKISDKLDRELNLSRTQNKEIHNINSDITRRMDQIKADKSLAKKDRMQRLKVLNTERSQRFKSVLSPTQYKKWNDWEMKRKERLEAKMDKKHDRKLARKAQ